MNVSNGKSPGIILKSKFETGKNKHKIVELQKFVDYITREEAIRKDKIEESYSFNADELLELQRIENGLAKLETETDQPLIKDIQQLDKYIDYMTRKKALIDNNDNEIINGAFSNKKRIIKKSDIQEIKKSVVNAKNNNSVMFQDVISFDNNFLIDEGYYDPKTKSLNEDVLYEATKSMMDGLIKKENLHNPFWFATIHRNTEHIHIHITSMEKENTREIIEYDGVMQARGKRKQSTLDDMVYNFGNKMLDRTNEFQKISELRKNIPLEIKGIVKESLMSINEKKKENNDSELKKYMISLKKDIPFNCKGYNSLPEEVQKKIDIVTKKLTKNNSKKNEYDSMTRTIDELYKQTYGERYNSNKYFNNRKSDLNQRMGNALVNQIKELKKDEYKKSKLNNFTKDKSLSLPYGSFSNNYKFKTEHGKVEKEKIENKNRLFLKDSKKIAMVQNKKVNSIKNKKDLNKVSREVNNDLQMYRAKKDYEKVQQKVEQEKARQSYEYNHNL